MSTNSVVPKRGEIWIVDLNPTVGAEIFKSRPCLVVSSDSMGKLPIKLVAPITDWKDAFGHSIWLVRITPNKSNGLNKVSAVDTLQLRGVAFQRFVEKTGVVSANILEEVVAAIAALVEYQ